MKVTLVGIGMGNPKTLTAEAYEVLEQAVLLLGAPRVLESLPGAFSGERVTAVSPQEILEELQGRAAGPACVACSGDVGFYSLAGSLRELLSEHAVSSIPGISTVQYLAARLGRNWETVRLVSAHGRDCNVVGHLLAAGEAFFLTGGAITPERIARLLTEAGLGKTQLAVGERLSYPEESIVHGTAEELTERRFLPLSAVWAIRPDLPRLHPWRSSGIPDSAFSRGEVPMTKQEVRAAILSKLKVREGDVLYDVGAGTGSVSVELALLSPMNTVYAIEMKPEACKLIEENRVRFGAYHIRLVEGGAPQALRPLPAPDAAFIGGSGGNLFPIIRAILEKNPAARLAVSAVTVETLARLTEAAKEFGLLDVELMQISVNRTRAAGRYHLFDTQTPVFLMSGRGAGRC